MALHDNTSLAPVNQRVLGSSPRGGAKVEIQLMKIGWIFLFKAYSTVSNCIMCNNCTFQQKVNLPSYFE